MKRKIKQHARHSGVVVDQDSGGGGVGSVVDDVDCGDGGDCGDGDGSVVDDVDGGDGDHNENTHKDDQGKEGKVGRGHKRCESKMAE